MWIHNHINICSTTANNFQLQKPLNTHNVFHVAESGEETDMARLSVWGLEKHNKVEN